MLWYRSHDTICVTLHIISAIQWYRFICCGQFCDDSIEYSIIYNNTYCDTYFTYNMFLDSCVLQYTDIRVYNPILSTFLVDFCKASTVALLPQPAHDHIQHSQLGTISCHQGSATCHSALRGLCSQKKRYFFCKILWSLKATRLCVNMIISVWNLTGASAGMVLKHLQNFPSIGSLWTHIPQLVRHLMVLGWSEQQRAVKISSIGHWECLVQWKISKVDV